MLVRDIEWSASSQNGEDGIIQHLLGSIDASEKTLVEIGAGSGSKNNSRYLLEHGWTGELFEKRWLGKLREASESWPGVSVSGPVDHKTVEVENLEPVLFSLDIDSTDYWVASRLLESGFRPQIAVLEYNAAIDPMPASVLPDREYNDVYFGCSLAAWQKLWRPLGYLFVTVCTAGINAFFVRRDSVRDVKHLGGIEWLGWIDCATVATKSGHYFERHRMLMGMELQEL